MPPQRHLVTTCRATVHDLVRDNNASPPDFLCLHASPPEPLCLHGRIRDGSNHAEPPWEAVEALLQLGLLDDAAGTPLARFARPALRNSRGLEVGRVEPVFALPRLAA